MDVRRAAAVGLIARGEQALDLEVDLETGEVSTGSTTATGSITGVSTGSTTGGRKGREVVLYVHLSQDALTSHDLNSPVELEQAGGRLLTAGQIAQWCRRPDTSRITVKPVIDLHQTQAVSAYQVPDRIAESVRLRDKTCVHPWCNRPARRCDLDHVDPYVDPDDGGPPDQTSTRESRATVQVAPPDEDPRRLDLHHPRTRHLPVAQPPRLDLAPRPARHHRPHPTRTRTTRPPARPTNQLTPHPAKPWRGHRHARGSPTCGYVPHFSASARITFTLRFVAGPSSFSTWALEFFASPYGMS